MHAVHDDLRMHICDKINQVHAQKLLLCNAITDALVLLARQKLIHLCRNS